MLRTALFLLAAALVPAVAGAQGRDRVAPPSRPVPAIAPAALPAAEPGQASQAATPRNPPVAVPSVPPAMRPQARPGASRALSAAMILVRRGSWDAAATAAARAGPLAQDIVEWHRLRAGRGDFDDAREFVRRNPDWPGLAYLGRRMEGALPMAGRSADVVAFLEDAPPQTGDGVLALARAHVALGDATAAARVVARAWTALPLGDRSEARLLALAPEAMTPLHAARLDAMLWQGETAAAERQLARVEDAGTVAVARARLALRSGDGVTAAMERVPAALAEDPGLSHDRFVWRMDRGRRADAMDFMIGRSASAATLGRPERWARARRSLAREAMRDGDHARAYAAASTHGLSAGSDFADLEWLSGYLALRFLDDPDAAVRHFRAFRAAVGTPISLGRAGYWEGRALEAAGDAEGAAAAYAFGAEWQTTFYGQLAAQAGGLPADPALAGLAPAPALPASVTQSSVLRAALLLHGAGERDLAERFLVHLGESLDGPLNAALADLASDVGGPHLALMIAKGASRRGIELPRSLYPVVDLGPTDPSVAPELALAIARRESEFDPTVVSGAGARGLMQLMPGTAQDMARAVGLPYSAARLLSDPAYNATLGTAYLALLERRFGANPVLVSVGYNAGPSRAAAWMADGGDPRDPAVDVVDWIEHIPFDETRNYVMRVAESLPVYRARLRGRTLAPGLLGELKAR